MKISEKAHLDHGLSKKHLDYLLFAFASRDRFFIETIYFPEELDEIPCALYGPTMGDAPLKEGEVFYTRRGDRPNLSRMVHLPSRPTRQVTVIAGPREGLPCALYTAFGGPLAPKEPGDPSLTEPEEMRKATAFWREHALAA